MRGDVVLFSAGFLAGDGVEFGVHKAAPRRANVRGHGNEGVASMHAERTDRDDHAVYRELGLTKPGCDCARCEHLRDLATVSKSRFGEEDDRALAALGRIVGAYSEIRPKGEPCMCNRLNGTLGYQTPKDCPSCEGTGVVVNEVEPKGSQR